MYNWFVTLTYDDWKTINETGCPPYSLDKSHLQTFNESMRKAARYCGEEYRFFACGEYGDLYERPHYHLSIFGLSPSFLGIQDDASRVKFRRGALQRGYFKCCSPPLMDDNGNPYWQSPVIASRWLFGDHKIYIANKKTFQYVAGYVTKKLTGKFGANWRARTGKISEFQMQSRPSIGQPWFLKYWDKLSLLDGDKLVNDSLSISDTEWKIPRIFSRWLETYVDRFDAPTYNRFMSDFRSKNYPDVPDRKDLKRKAAYDRYAAERYKDMRRSHKEVNNE